MKKVLFSLAILGSVSSFASDCTVYVPSPEKREIIDIDTPTNLINKRHNEGMDEAQAKLLNVLEKNGYSIVSKDSDARFIVEDYYKSCSVVDGKCHIAHGRVLYSDKTTGEEFGAYERTFDIIIDPGFGNGGYTLKQASKNKAFKRALKRGIHKCN